MRGIIVLLVSFLLLCSTATAAPTCLDKNGDTIRCGTPNAMQVGWTPTPEALLNRQSSKLGNGSSAGLLGAICVIALFLALIALLPDFDGTQKGDWEER